MILPNFELNCQLCLGQKIVQAERPGEEVHGSLACCSIRYFSIYVFHILHSGRFCTTITSEINILFQYQQEPSNHSVADKEKNPAIHI